MKHSEYQQLIQALAFLTTGNHGADTLRVLFDKREVEVPAREREPGGPATRMEPTDQARQHPLFKHKMLLLNGAVETVENLAGRMKRWTDGFVEENQARADQGLKASTDGRALYDSMSRFMSATATPVPGARDIYDKTTVIHYACGDQLIPGVRAQCQEWMKMLATWFPDLNTEKSTGQQSQPHNDKMNASQYTAMTDSEMWAEQFRHDVVEKQGYKDAVSNGDITKPFTWNSTISELADWLDRYDIIPKDRKGDSKPRCLWHRVDGVFLNHKNGEPITAQQLKDAFKKLPK